MHELTICNNIINLAITHARKNNAVCIKAVCIEVGDLAGIDLDALRFSFPIAAARSIAQNATLEITTVPGRARCDICQKTVTLNSYLDPCSQCGQFNYQIMKGKELRIVKMEVE